MFRWWAGGLHPICRAVFGLHLWGPVGFWGRHSTAEQEAAVLCLRLATADLPGGAQFLPVAAGGLSAFRVSGTAELRLRRFLHMAEAAVLSTLRLLNQLEDWQDRAERLLADRSGRTPKQLVALLAEYPLVSVPMAEAQTGSSRATVQRNLNEMASQGLIREVTGQGRYRTWAAQM